MKTWEMIKELTENPEKEFVLKNNKNFHVFMTNYGSVFYGAIGDGAVKPLEPDEYLKREWEEVKRPVNFMTAVKSGKKIQIKHDFIDGDIDYLGEKYVSLDTLLWELGEKLSDDGVRDVIMNGKFYIED